MPKWLSKPKLLQIRLSTLISTVLCLIAIIQFFAKTGIYNYTHIPTERISDELFISVASNINWKKQPTCSYDAVLQSTNSIDNQEVPKNYDDFSPKGIVNGSYMPEDCTPLFSVAILVTYRNRQSQLDVFLPYIHNFLRKQKIHYKIYVIEQQDSLIFNKGTLYNIGARYAIREKFPCLILHDVDLLPLDENNLYACTAMPRHMSARIDKFRYVLPYYNLVGGVLAIKSSQYTMVDGLSNKFEGWGGEDDDFAERLSDYNLEVTRFPGQMSRYSMLRHPPELKNARRSTVMAANRADRGCRGRACPTDGYDSAKYRLMSVRQQRLFTHIGLRL